MSAIRKQLETLAPIMDISIENRELLAYVMGDNDDSHFDYNRYVALLESLGTRKDIPYILRIPSGMWDTDRRMHKMMGREGKDPAHLFFDKIIEILLRENPDTPCSYKEDKKERFRLRIGEEEHVIGKFEFDRWSRSDYKMTQLPDFLNKLGEVLEKHVHSGVMHVGFAKDDMKRTFAKFRYIILFVPYGEKELPGVIDSLHWMPLFFGEEKNARYGEMKGVKYKTTPNYIDLEWQDTSLAALYLFIGGFLSLFLLAQWFGDANRPLGLLIAALIIGVVTAALMALSYANRKRTMHFDQRELRLERGRIPFLWEGRKEIRIPCQDLMAFSVDDGKLLATVHPGKNIVLDKNCGGYYFIKEMVEEFWKGKKRR
jgi:hypothetical protein